jgi:hypothetical protein
MGATRLTVQDVLSTPAPAVAATDPVTQQTVQAIAPPVNTSTSVESVDVSGVQDATNNIINSMREQGLTYAQAFEKYHAKPQLNQTGVDNTRKLQKAAVIADMIRLATEGVGAFAGANVQRRDSSQVQGQLANRLLQQYAEYNKNMQDWNTKGVDAAMKDVQLANKLYDRNLAAAPKTRTTTQDNAWDRAKHAEDKDVAREGITAANSRNSESIQAANKRAAAANAARLQAAQIAKDAKNDEEKGLTTIVFGDNSGKAKISKAAEKSFYNAAYQAMLSDPTFKSTGNATAKEIEQINNDLSFEGKASKIRVYVDQHLHESPKALQLLQSNATSFERNVAPEQPQTRQSSGAGVAPWLQPKAQTKKAPWLQ